MRHLQSRVFRLTWHQRDLSKQLQLGHRKASTSKRPQYPDFPALDLKWQKRWQETELGRFSNQSCRIEVDVTKAGVEDSSRRETKYVLPMFPYPSGTLHMGHIRVYTISDVISRFNMMRGFDVLHPIGWDAFGLPAENAAIERGVDPAKWTASNIEQMKGQLQSMNGVWDWSREIRTCDPSYYKHTQRIFLMLHEAGLAYQKEALVNWDPVDQTVLANEQVDGKGNSWRSGAKVEQRMLKQWFLATTHYQAELYDDLLKLEKSKNWPARVVDMQKNWLGKSTGVQFAFDLEMPYSRIEAAKGILSELKSVEIFTTRLDTLFGVQFLAVSLNHPLVHAYAAHDPDLRSFIENSTNLPLDSKEGYLLPYVAKSDLLGVRRISIYAAPYVLDGYGTGAVMGVPAHDVRDHAFWRFHRKDESVIFTVKPREDSTYSQDQPLTERGVVANTGGVCDGLTSQEATAVLKTKLNSLGYKAETRTRWRLRDWLISRQRHWGAPIPIIHCDDCGPVPVPIKELPVELPKLRPEQFKGRNGNPLQSTDEWVNTKCPTCKGAAKRDTDTMDTFMDSSWYFFRFMDPGNAKAPFDPELARALMPVDFYVGGVEHAILHLLYARFIAKFLASEKGGKVWPTDFAEPFRKLVTQGMVHGKTYSDPASGRFLKPEEVDLTDPKAPKITASGITPNISFEKMSKSKYNGVDPASCIFKYGADVTRAHMLFAAPEGEVLEWEEERIAGMTRWLGKIWRIVDAQVGSLEPGSPLSWENTSDHADAEVALLVELSRVSQAVTSKLQDASGLNTVVSDLMKLTNAIENYRSAAKDKIHQDILLFCTHNLVRMIAPLTPAFAEEAWQHLHMSSTNDLLSIFTTAWPRRFDYEPEAALANHTYVVTVDGKKRFTCKASEITDPVGLEAAALKIVLESQEGLAWSISEKNRLLLESMKKVIVKVLGAQARTLVNIVTKA